MHLSNLIIVAGESDEFVERSIPKWLWLGIALKLKTILSPPPKKYGFSLESPKKSDEEKKNLV